MALSTRVYSKSDTQSVEIIIHEGKYENRVRIVTFIDEKRTNVDINYIYYADGPRAREIINLVKDEKDTFFGKKPLDTRENFTLAIEEYIKESGGRLTNS